MRLKTLCVGLLAGALSVGAMACAPSCQVPQREMPAGATFSGLWYTNFGHMKLTQRSDGETRGTFSYKTGGEMVGTVTGGVFVFEWVQPGDFQVGRREVRGKGYLVISDDGLEVNGEWGYGENYTGGGDWTGQKQTEIYR